MRRFTATIIKPQLLRELVVPVCHGSPGCPRQEGAATWSHCELGPDPSPVLNGGIIPSPKLGSEAKSSTRGFDPLSLLCFAFGGDRDPWPASRWKQGLAPRRSHQLSLFLVLLLYCCSRIICIS